MEATQMAELEKNPAFQAWIEKQIGAQVEEKMQPLRDEISALQKKIKKIEKAMPEDKVSMLIASHELDHLLPAFIIATGAASFGMHVHMYFTLWGITALKQKSVYSGKTIAEKMLTMMLPDKPATTGLSRLNMMGMGPMLMKGMMKSEHVETLPDLIDLAEELGVQMTACQMTMGIMGITKEELRPSVDFGGVAAYVASASEAKVTLYI